MKKRRSAEFYKNTDGSLYKSETVYIIVDDREKPLMAYTDGELKHGASKISPRDYEEAQQLREIGKKREQIKEQEKKLIGKNKAVKELEKLGLTAEAARLIVYG